MNVQSAFFTAVVLTLGVALAHWGPVNAADNLSKDATGNFELICLTEQPAIVEGESVTLKVWASTFDGQPMAVPINLQWEVDAGRVETQTAVTRWDLSTVKVQPAAARKAIATVKATRPGWDEVRCTVEVFIGKKESRAPDRGTIRGEDLLSA